MHTYMNLHLNVDNVDRWFTKSTEISTPHSFTASYLNEVKCV